MCWMHHQVNRNHQVGITVLSYPKKRLKYAHRQ